MRIVWLSLFLTILGEYATFSLLLRQLRFSDLFFLCLINAVTNPLVLYFHRTALLGFPWKWGFVFLEIMVVVVEAILMRIIYQFSLKRAVTVSLACNFVSAVMGFFL